MDLLSQVTTREEFQRKWNDTHTELALQDKLRRIGNLEVSPERNVKARGYIPGKRLIEAKAFKNREDKFKAMLLDAVDVRKDELMDMDYYKLLTITQKMLPQKVEQESNVTVTLADIFKKATLNEEIIDIDAEVQSD